MPPLLCASPVILDQSFPRDNDELTLVAGALGEIEGLLQTDKARLVLTDVLRDLVEDFEWQRAGPFLLLNDIHRLLNQWFLQPHERLVKIDVSHIERYRPHPLPKGRENQGLIEFWSDELGKMLVFHDSYCCSTEYFIGVACESAFSGGTLTEYDNPDSRRAFPLVGPNEVEYLSDAYDWSDIPADIHQRKVTFDNACRNCFLIGAIRIDNPSSGSHYKVRFKGSRPWILDSNYDPVLEDHLKELVEITGYPLNVIKTALIEGRMPMKRVLRFQKCG